MKKVFSSIVCLFLFSGLLTAQGVMTPELLWKLNRVSALGISKDGKHIVYKVSTPSVELNNFSTKYYSAPLEGGEAKEITDYKSLLHDKKISPNGQYALHVDRVKLLKVSGADYYPEFSKTSAVIYDELDYRHWDKWEDGTYSHLFLKRIRDEKGNSVSEEAIDLMKDEPFHCPIKPFGGDENYLWSPDGKSVLYVSKKLSGTAYALSTNTDIYSYNISSGETTNLTKGMMGYDTEPAFSSTGVLAWMSMATDGNEADKNDIYVSFNGVQTNLTAQWDESVRHFKWSNDGKKIYFTAATEGTVQLFEVDFPGKSKKTPVVKQISQGVFDITSIVGQVGNRLIVTRTDMNHATEIFSYDLTKNTFTPLTRVNESLYAGIKMSPVEKRMVKTTDGKEMLVWMIFPPDFDSTKKYPTLLYCQGGPQSALTQFYSFRWNFQLMAAQGYIVVAPNRRGMPGHGVAWNDQISGDWGGQVMDDYLSAIDDAAKESYVDKDRLGAIGASYGGYSVFYLAGIHNKRFKTFIAHAGVFNTESMYGTTEEVFFSKHDFGGAYWEKDNAIAQKAYSEFNPLKKVAAWDTPILITHGGIDYRVPIGQGQEAYHAAQLLGIKSRFVLIPDEGHWISIPQNGMVWQREFSRWLKETL